MSESLPTLEQLLERRGVRKNQDFGDYQDYILAREKTLTPTLSGANRFFSGSMHLAMRRIMSLRRFKY